MAESVEEEKLELERYQADVEHKKLEYEHYRLTYEAYKDSMQAAIGFASLALKSLLILNGGAALSFLALIAHMYSQNNPLVKSLPSDLIPALLFFGWGAFAAVLTTATSYISQSYYSYTSDEESKTKPKNYKKMGAIYHGVAIFTASLGLGFFIFGMYAAMNAFQSI